MYCKNCGKDIPDNSKFCLYCGTDLGETEKNREKVEVALSNKDSKPMQIEIRHPEVNKSSAIATEIIGNIKMIGLALLLFTLYMGWFILSRQKDIKEYDYYWKHSYVGESKYDPDFVTGGTYYFAWEEAYYNDLYVRKNNHVSFDRLCSKSKTPEQYLVEAKILEKQLKLSKSKIDELQKTAKERSKSDIDSWNNRINNYRQSGYEEEKNKHIVYAAIICLVITIFGRYILKLFKWAQKNKTK